MVDPIGESNVPLTKDIVPEKPRVAFPTFAEWVSDGNAEQIVLDVGSERTIYEVPDNKTLFITSCYITGAELANASTHGNLTISVSSGGFAEETNLLAIKIDHTAGQHGGANTASLSFPMPIRFVSGAIIKLIESGMTTPSMRAGFTAFLLDKKISIR